MTTTSMTTPRTGTPLWLTLSSLGGIAWNLFGIVQFAGAVTATHDMLVAAGMTPAQAAVMTGHPAWMTLAFGAGVAGGLAGAAGGRPDAG